MVRRVGPQKQSRSASNKFARFGRIFIITSICYKNIASFSGGRGCQSIASLNFYYCILSGWLRIPVGFVCRHTSVLRAVCFIFICCQNVLTAIRICREDYDIYVNSKKNESLCDGLSSVIKGIGAPVFGFADGQTTGIQKAQSQLRLQEMSLSEISQMSENVRASSKNFTSIFPSLYMISLFGIVFDVTSGIEFYAPGAPYDMFLGHDITRNIALASTDTKNLDADLEGLSGENLDEVFLRFN